MFRNLNPHYVFSCRSAVLAGLVAGFINVSAQINRPDNTGDLFRGTSMMYDANYIGVLDQLALVDDATLFDASEAERADWLKCRATVHTDASTAIELLKRFLSTYPASPLRYSATVLLGDCLLAEGDAEEALNVYDNVADGALTSDQLAELNYHRGYANLLAEDVEAAERCFMLARENSRWQGHSDFYLGYIAYSRYDFPAAIKYFEQADRSQTPGKLADFYMAQIYYSQADYKKALELARAMSNRIDVDPTYSLEATRIAGESLFRLGNSKEGATLLRKYVNSASSPERSALYFIGTYDYNRGKAADAIESLQRVVEGNVDDALSQSAYLYLGQALMARGDRNAAVLAFEKAMKADYDRDVQETAFYNYAVAKFGGARTPFGSSVATFEEFLAKYPDGKYSGMVQEYLVDGYLANGEYEAALKSIERMANPGQAVLAAKQKALYALGTRALATNDVDASIGYLRAARNIRSADRAVEGRIALSLGEALARKNDHTEAIGLFNEYMANAPADDVNRPLAAYDLGYSYFALKDYGKANSNFMTVVSSPGNLDDYVLTDALNRMADSKLYAGSISEALALYKRSYEQAPSRGDYPLFQMAVIQGYQRKNKDKINTLTTLLAEYPKSTLLPDALLEMTEGYIQLGDNNSAVATYRRLVADYPDTEQGRQGYLQMALTLLNTGNRAEAIDAYRQVVSRYPSSEEARMAVDELKRLSAEDETLPEFADWLQGIENAPKLEVGDADRLTFEAAEKAWATSRDASRLQRYVSDYPDGGFRARALGYLVENAVSAGNHEEVILLAAQIVERYPHAAQVEGALMAKGDAEFTLGRAEDALSTWRLLETKASAPSTQNAARTGIMRAARDLGDNEGVIEAAEALLASSTLGSEIRSEAQFSLALARANQGNTAEAMELWQELAQNTDDLYGAKSAYYMAEQSFADGNTSEALERVEALIDSGTPHAYWLARGFILLSDIYAAQDKPFEAREYLKSLRDNYPGKETDIFNMIDERLSNL